MKAISYTDLSSAIRSVIAGLLLLALSVQGIIPTGYMPDLTGHKSSGYSIVICGGHDNADVSANDTKGDPTDKSKVKDHASHRKNACPYSPGLIPGYACKDNVEVLVAASALLMRLMASAFYLPRYRANRSAYQTGPPLLLAHR